VRKLDVSAQIAGIKFNLGNSFSDGPFLPDDIAVMPGSPGTVVVSKIKGNYAAGMTVYDEGVPRPQSLSTGGPVEFASPTKLYAGNIVVQKIAVDSNGLTNLSSPISSNSGQTQLAGGLLYISSGAVVDPETGVIKGRFSGLDSGSVMAIDVAKNRAFFLTYNYSSSSPVLRSYELDTFRPIASISFAGVFGWNSFEPSSSLVRWGKNGLAFRMQDRIFLIQSALVDASDPIPAATPTPSPTPTPTPAYIPTIVNKVNLPANDLVINTATQTLYASVPSTAGATTGNTITSVDPKTGAIGASTFIGSEPGKLAISDDGEVLYVHLNGAKAIRRFDTATKTPGVQFSIGVDRPGDMEVVPGSPQSLAVSRGSSFNGGVAVYDNGVQRPNTSTNNGSYYSSTVSIEFGASPSKLYGLNDGSSSNEITKMQLDASGIKVLGNVRYLLSSYGYGFEFAGGRLYSATGYVADPEAETLVGRFNGGGSTLVVDQALGRAFFLSTGSGGTGSNFVLTAYDINTFLPLGSVTFPGVSDTPVGLVRWGTNGLAFATLPNSYNSSGATSQIYLIRSALVSESEPIPSVLEFSAADYNASESSSGAGAVITVTRSGATSGAVTVNYATGGGTATPGSDYTTTSGTLSFADGERSKTFTVPILNDNLYEGIVRETIGLTLSNPTGSVTLGSQATATLAIQDNDSRPSITPVSLSVLEGQSGTTDAQFTVRLSNPSIETISMSYATADRTATAASDYVAASGTLTFQPGEIEKTFPLQIKGDTIEESTEQFAINFSNPVNVFIFSTTGLVTIEDDDRLIIGFAAAEFAAGEGDGSALITVTRSGATSGAVTINYATGGGTATPGSDYTVTSGTLSFADGERSKTFSVPILNDNLYEGIVRETIGLTLSNPTGNVRLGPQATATIAIQDNDSRPSIAPVNLSVLEGQSGTTEAQFTVRLSNPSVEPISITYVTADRTATAPSDYDATSGRLIFQPGEIEKTFPLQIKGDTVEESTEQFAINLSTPINVSISSATGLVTIEDDDRPIIGFAADEFTAGEGDGRAVITVTRSGATTATASIGYLTLDDSRAIRCDDSTASEGAAFARCDYATTLDTLVFAPGESRKTFTVPLVDDGHDEPRELIQLRLVAPVGASLGSPSSSVLSIVDNDEADQPNPVDAHAFFVRQHYLDFLSREPEAEGLAAWAGVLARCADPFNRDAESLSAQCDRNLVSSSFFRSTEFELKGYFVYRFYRVAFDRRPSYAEFVADMRRVTGQTAEEVYGRRRAFTEAWVQQTEFLNLHGAKTNAAYVDSLLGRFGLNAINTTDPANPDGDAPVRLTRDELVAALDAQPQRLTRAQVLRAIVQSREIDASEYNGAFVAMQYYGYLRRAPEQSGYDAWLQVITRGDGHRVMVNGFMNSTEYRLRFGK
jgi:hypothetical protein